MHEGVYRLVPAGWPSKATAASPAPADGADRIPFSCASALPHAPPGRRLRRVRFRSCPGSDLELVVANDVDGALDVHGVPKDAWWTVRCSDLPERHLRLFGGTRSLQELLRRYGFLDASGCVNHRDAEAVYADASAPLPASRVLEVVPSRLRDARGVPQFYKNSGVCWFATLCWTSFANADMCAFLTRHMPRDLAQLARRCLFSREAAEAFRKRLWYDYAVGDNVEDSPEMDGRNGFSEFAVLCAKLGVPMIVYRESGGRMAPVAPELTDRRGGTVRMRPPRSCREPHLLVLRYQDGDHARRHPIRRRVVHCGERYRCVGIYKGKRKCGHQIGASFYTGHWRHVSFGDADMHKSDIGPSFSHFDGTRWRGSDWWRACNELAYVTKYGRDYREFCEFGWHNPDDKRLDAYRGGHKTGSLSMDIMYFRK
jgi:hypothetical protein